MHWPEKNTISHDAKSVKPDTVQEKPQRSFVFYPTSKEQMFRKGYQQRLCCLKIPAVIYQNFNIMFQEAH